MLYYQSFGWMDSVTLHSRNTFYVFRHFQKNNFEVLPAFIF